MCVCEAEKWGETTISVAHSSFLAILDRKRALGIPPHGGGRRKKAKNVAVGVAGQRCPQDPHLQLHPDPARAGVKVGSQPHANVY